MPASERRLTLVARDAEPEPLTTWLSVNDIARETRFAPRTIRLWLQLGYMPSFVYGKQLRVERTEFEAWARRVATGQFRAPYRRMRQKEQEPIEQTKLRRTGSR